MRLQQVARRDRRFLKVVYPNGDTSGPFGNVCDGIDEILIRQPPVDSFWLSVMLDHRTHRRTARCVRKNDPDSQG